MKTELLKEILADENAMQEAAGIAKILTEESFKKTEVMIAEMNKALSSPLTPPKVEVTKEMIWNSFAAEFQIEEGFTPNPRDGRVIALFHWFRLGARCVNKAITEERLIAALNKVKASHGPSCSPDGHANPEWYMAFKKELGL